MASNCARGGSGWVLGGIGQHQFLEQVVFLISPREAEPRYISQIVVQLEKGLGEAPPPGPHQPVHEHLLGEPISIHR